MIILCMCRFRKYFFWGEKGVGGGGFRDSFVFWVVVGSFIVFFWKCYNLNLINFNFLERVFDYFYIVFLIVYNYILKIMKKIKDMNFK